MLAIDLKPGIPGLRGICAAQVDVLAFSWRKAKNIMLDDEYAAACDQAAHICMNYARIP